MRRLISPIKLVVISLALLTSVTSFGKSTGKKDGYRIQVKINGLKDTNLLLGHHFGTKKYVVDTARLNSKGEGVFAGDTLLDGGIYLIITPSMNYFEIIIDKEQRFSLTTDTIDMLKNLKITGSEENKQFDNYQFFMIENQKTAAAQKKKYEHYKKMADSVGLKPAKKKLYQDSLATTKTEIGALDSLVKKKWDEIITTSPNSLLTSILKSMKEEIVPHSPRDANGKMIDSSFQYKYYKTHFFDNIDFSDYRLLRTPILETKIDEYLDKVCYQIPDSLEKDVDRVVSLSKSNIKVYKYAVQYVFNKYNNPKIMGMDRLFVYISEKYYLSGLAYWSKSDTAFLNKLQDRVIHEKPNLLGEIAPELRLSDLQGNVVSLHSIKADYIVLDFFDTECGHCQKIIPEWKKLYEEHKFKDKNIVTLLVETQVDKEKMQKFVEKHELQNFMMAYDPYQTTNFRLLYDVYSTPTPYVLDKDKKIIAKRIEPEVIADFLEKMLERDAAMKKKATK